MEENYLIICDEQQKSYFSQIVKNKDFKFIVSEEEFEKIISNELTDYNRIIVFAELQWKDKKYTDFYGIDIAVRVRLVKKVLAPMCILSFMPKEFFDGKSKEEVMYNILKVRGTAFYRLPSSLETITDALKSTHPLSSATLAFLTLYLIKIKNLIGDINHNLRINSTKEQVEQTLSKIDQFSKLEIYHTLRGIANEIKLAHQTDNGGKFEDEIKKLADKLNALQEKQLSLDEKKEKILLLEDKNDELLWAKSELENYFDIHAFQDANEIIKEIDADEKNDYRALICDWELLKPNCSEHQNWLGFEVLEYAAKKRFYALFSLTITDEYSVRDVDSCLNFEHQIFKKEFVEEKSKALWNSYIPIIQQKIRQITELICSIPDCANWVTTTRRNQTLPSYKTQYIEKRNSSDWAVFEHNISEQVNNYFMYPVDESILEIREDIESLLITRRIFYKVFLTKYLKSLESTEKFAKTTAIAFAMGKEFGRSTEGDSNRNKFLSDLCLKFNNLPLVGMLPEEKAWLNSQGIYI
jgi:hypothetical protein